MAVKIPLKMSDGTMVRTIEDLREHFDLEAVLGYYSSGRLAEWLEGRYCEKEAAEVRKLEADAKDFNETLCAVLGVTYEKKAGDKTDLDHVRKKNERLDKVKKYTMNDEILAAIDWVAFTQKELEDLSKRQDTLMVDDNGNKVIYLCGEHFTIPDDLVRITYKGLNKPIVDVSNNFLERKIVFDGVKLNGVNDVIWHAERTTDLTEAFRLWEMAAEQGNAEAQYRLGVCYYNGEGAETDYKKAMKWFCKATEKGHVKPFRHNGYYFNDFQTCITTNPIIALKKDGTVVENLEVPTQNWENIIAVFSGDSVIAGLKSNGTVVTVKRAYRNMIQTLIFPKTITQCGTQDWCNIVNLSVKDEFIIGVKSDGKIVANKENYDGQYEVQNWCDIVTVSIGDGYIIGLKKDGMVVVAGNINCRQCAIQNWRDIVAISTAEYHTIGLKRDGTVMVAGFYDGTDETDDNSLTACLLDKSAIQEILNWKDIKAISFDGINAVGLKKDGTVVLESVSSVENLSTCSQIVQTWCDIVAISTGNGCIVGLKKDGTICTVPNDDRVQYCSNWSKIGLVLNEFVEDTKTY